MPVAQDLNLTVELIAAGRPNRPGRIIRPTHITVHNTDNDDPGADAVAHSKFVRNTGHYVHNGQVIQVSWHATVDDKVAIRHLPLNELGYHAKSGNAVSVGIEICMHRGIDQAAADRRAALLVAALMHDLRVPTANVVTHKHWTGKACPSKLLNNGEVGAKWNAFIALVREQWQALEGVGGPHIARSPEIAFEASRPLWEKAIDRALLEPEIDHALVRAELRKQLEP